jgi:hypothetical protein
MLLQLFSLTTAANSEITTSYLYWNLSFIKIKALKTLVLKLVTA